MTCTNTKDFSFFDFIAAAVFIFCSLSGGKFALADNGYDITGHYFSADPQRPGKYLENAVWTVSNSNDWVGFVNGLAKLPRIDLGDDIIDPMALGNKDIIYFKQINPDQLSGNDIYLSKTGILQFAKMPTDLFFQADDEFRAFLDSELKANPGYGEESPAKKVSLSEEGIVVVFRGSLVLDNPTWVIKQDDVGRFNKYLSFIKRLKNIGYGETARMEMRNDVYDKAQAYILYLNYPGATSKIMTVSYGGGIRATNVQVKNYNYEDPKGYFKLFLTQAKGTVHREEILKNSEKTDPSRNKDF